MFYTIFTTALAPAEETPLLSSPYYEEVASTAPVLSTLPPNQAPEILALISILLAIIGRIAMQGIVKRELMRIASF